MTLSSATPGLYYDENAELPPHASLTYQEVKAAGPPAQPLDFPTPTVHRALPVSGRAMDHRYGQIHEIKAMSRTDQRIAYLFKKNIAKTTYGCVKLCVVLRRRSHRFDFRCGEAEWISTDEMVAIKASSWSKMRQHRGRHLEDPLKGTTSRQDFSFLRIPRVDLSHSHLTSFFSSLQKLRLSSTWETIIPTFWVAWKSSRTMNSSTRSCLIAQEVTCTR